MHQENKKLLEELKNCAAECNHCYNACLEEEDVAMMTRCIELDRDCAEICHITSSFIERNSEHAHDLLVACANICEACAEECDKHEAEHCKRCAEACHSCATACKQMAEAV